MLEQQLAEIHALQSEAQGARRGEIGGRLPVGRALIAEHAAQNRAQHVRLDVDPHH
ncbi:hypothetical protein [Ancylobacter sp. FA202]|uniref:hypothetical protein n=1 Tax=Ancylobacter sp. FA202 TaxID=1111106 RepID=UPI000377191A|nr:hypothetical protein [Ancylobacter sp. FA202]